jgi:hypothetical protein
MNHRCPLPYIDISLFFEYVINFLLHYGAIVRSDVIFTREYHPVDKFMAQPRLMKLNRANINENYLSYDVVSIALPWLIS